MPKRDKRREMEERLGRIEGYLARPKLIAPILNDAIRQLGDGLNLNNFDPSKPVGELSLYQELLAMERNYRNRTQSLGEAAPYESIAKRMLRIEMQRAQLRSQSGLPERLERLYGQIAAAFKAYQGEKATPEATIAIDELIRQAPVDNDVEIAFFDRGGFSYIYRTEETRRLDKEFKKRWDEVVDSLSLITTDLMAIFVDVANGACYFGGVRIDELKRHKEFGDLEDHVKKGFIALKTCPEDKMQFAVPIRFT